METAQPYEMTVGLEIHIQLNTKSKLFSNDSTAFGAAANSQTNEISLAHPGTLPVLNKPAISSAIKIGLACHAEIASIVHFDRKHYFYPDSPLGYQITQQNQPVCLGGYVSIPFNSMEKKISLDKIHLEADAGKSIHDQSDKYTLIDLNRAGMPLLELVTKPVLQSPAEAGVFINEVQKIVRCLEISDGNMEEGSLRCDANISLKEKSAKHLGQKVEVKNMNSVRNIKKALQYEYKRQSKILASGRRVDAESRLFNVTTGKTESMRQKEEAHDYRYFPDPDIAPYEISLAMLKKVAEEMPMLPYDWRRLFTKEYKLLQKEAIAIANHSFTANLFIDLVNQDIATELAVKWILGPVKALFNREESMQINLASEQLSKLIVLVDKNKVTYKNAVDLVLPGLVKRVNADTNSIIKELKLVVEDDKSSLLLIIEEILSKHPDEVEAYKKGKKVLLQLFMGQVMKKTQGKADPKITMKLIKDKLG